MLEPVKASSLTANPKANSILLYGHPKTGKTLFGAHFPKKIAILDFDRGAITARGMEGIDIYELWKVNINMQINEFNSIMRELIKQEDLSTIIIDTLAHLGQAWMFKILKSPDKVPEFKDWNIFAREMNAMLKKIRDDHNKTIIVNAHIQYKSWSTPKREQPDKDALLAGGFPKIDSIFTTVGGMFNEYYLLKTKKTGAKTAYQVVVRGDNICQTGSRLLKNEVEILDWTNKDPYKLLIANLKQKGGF